MTHCCGHSPVKLLGEKAVLCDTQHLPMSHNERVCDGEEGKMEERKGSTYPAGRGGERSRSFPRGVSEIAFFFSYQTSTFIYFLLGEVTRMEGRYGRTGK